MRSNRMDARLLGVVVACGWTLAGGSVLGQSADDMRAVMQIEASGQPSMEMEYFLGDQRMRMDVSEELSIISTSGSEPSMLMIQHPQQRYIEWGPQQLQMMQQMLQQVPGASTGADVSALDPEDVQFEATGQNAQIGPWSAFEVLMIGPDGQEGALWLSADAEIGLFEISVRAADAVSMLQNPMAGGASGGAQQFLQYQALAQAQGLPDGGVVRIVTNDDGESGTITLLSVEAGPLAAGTFEAPAGYDQMQMPAIPGLPE